MNRILSIIFASIVALSLSSCLKKDLEELKVFDGKEITGIKEVQFRYKADEKMPVSGEQQVKVVSLEVDAKKVVIDKEKGTIVFDAKVPTNVPASQKGKITNKNLVVVVNLSSAAMVKPLSGVKFGMPGDWSKPNKFLVTAANGDTQEWTITLNFI